MRSRKVSFSYYSRCPYHSTFSRHFRVSFNLIHSFSNSCRHSIMSVLYIPQILNYGNQWRQSRKQSTASSSSSHAVFSVFMQQHAKSVSIHYNSITLCCAQLNIISICYTFINPIKWFPSTMYVHLFIFACGKLIKMRIKKINSV